jgi:hypothetical protein
MSPISAYSGTPANSLTRLLLAGISGRSAVLAGAHAENSARLDRVNGVAPDQPDESHDPQHHDDRRQASDDGSSHGPAAIYEPSEHARATVLRPKRKDQQAEANPTASSETTDDTESGLGKPTLSAEEQQQQVDELKKRDQEVRRHEQAHKAAAGSHAAGGPSFEYQTGPDGKRYAVGGEVPIDTSPVQGNPRATITKMQQLRRAALAPANPSGTDRQVAARASQAEREARAELAEQKSTEQADANKNRSHPDTPFAAFANTTANNRSGQRLDVVG